MSETGTSGHHVGSSPGDGPVFVVGSMRSGSTMLRLILDSHPRIAIPAETGFMGAVLATRQIPGWKYGAEWFQRIEWAEGELDDRIRSFYDEMFTRYAAARGKARWGDKTPFHTGHIAAMAEVFPTSVFVGIVRHPGAVASSLNKSFHYAFSDAVSYWAATNLDLVRGASALGDRFVLCRYEDLVTDGEPVLREVMATLGEEFSDALLHHHEVQRDQGAPRVVDGSTSSREPIDARRALRWADDAGPEHLAALEPVAELADFFGYSPTGTGPAPAAGESASADSSQQPGARRWTLTGDNVARRRAAYADRVDFDATPPTLAIDADPQELARRLAQVEAALDRTRTRRAVRIADAMRRVQRGRSWRDVRAVWSSVRGSKSG